VIRGIWGAAANDAWLVGDAGAVSHWNGSAWTARAAPTPFNLQAISGVAGNDVWAVGDAGVLVHFDGTAWTPDDRPTTQNLRDVWAAAVDDDIWAVGDSGVILRSRGNDVFATVTSPTTANLKRVWGATPTDIWMIGVAGTVIEWNNGTFVTWPQLGVRDLTGIWGTSRSNIWVAGSGLYHFDGNAWTQVPFYKTGIGFNGVWTNDPDRVFLVGSDINAVNYRAFFDYRPSTNSWSEVVMGGGDVIWGTGPSDLWTTAYPGDGDHFDGTSWTPYRTDTLYDLWGSGPGDVWGVGFYGVIVHHGPGNGAWTVNGIQQDHMTNNDLYGMHGANADAVWVVGQYGTILRKQRF
jgi:hypothetical protein